MSDLFSIGASGARAYRTALAGVAENVANADTPGYVRRRVMLTEAVASGRTNPLYTRPSTLSGVVVTGTRRDADPILDSAVRGSNASAAQAQTRATWLEDIEGALGDDAAGVGARTSQFLSGLDRLAAAPRDSALHATSIADLDTVTRAFRDTAARLDASGTRLHAAADNALAGVQSDLNELFTVNRALAGASDTGVDRAQLLDRRDAALDRIGAALPVTVSFDAADRASLTIGGVTLLDTNSTGILGWQVAASGTRQLTLNGAALPDPGSGALSGFIAGAADLAGTRTALDTLANDTATRLNAWNTAGRDTGGNPGAALIAGTTAANLALTGAAIAPGDATTDNGNLLAIGGLRGAGGPEASWQALIHGHAAITANTRTSADAARARADATEDRRDALSGVDLDREAAEMMRLQAAYDAAARVIQVARETMQSILAIF